MDLMNYFFNLVVPPASMVMMAFAWPALSILHAAEWIYRSVTSDDMESKVVVITGASSAIGEKIAYQYARRKTNLVLVAKREQRLWGIRENAKLLGAKQVVVIAADVVKEEDCQRFIIETVNYFGQLDHLVNATNLGYSFYFEEALDTSMFPHLMAAKAAVINFYETLRFEVKDDVGITIATHGWICREMNQTKFILEEGAEMQWKEDKEVPIYEAHVEDFAKMIVAGACRGEAYVKCPSWYDVFFLYRALIPDVIGWTFRRLNDGESRRLLEAPAPQKDISPPRAFAPASPKRR